MMSFVFAGVSISLLLVQVNAFWAENLDELNTSHCFNNSLGNSTGHQIFFYLYTNKNRSHFENVTEFEDIKNSSLNSELKTIFLIHGWKNDISSPMIQLVKDGYLNLSDYNIIGVDWSFGTDNQYPTSANCVSLVATWIGTFINYLIDPMNGLNVSIDKVNLVGHSLGAHIAGIVGEYFRLVEVGKTIPVIVGLDPAGPFFIEQNMYNRLDLHDASYVEVIHTSNKYFGIYSLLGLLGFRTLGMPEPIGDVDIYPNYGGYQPLCTNAFDRFLGNCAHSQAYVYFAYSLNATKNDSSIAIECEGGFDDISREKCSNNNNTFHYMGDPANRAYLSKSKLTPTFGVYYFETEYDGGWWNTFQYYWLITLAILLPIAIILLVFAVVVVGVILIFRQFGYQCERIRVDEVEPIAPGLNQDNDGPEAISSNRIMRQLYQMRQRFQIWIRIMRNWSVENSTEVEQDLEQDRQPLVGC